MTRYDNSGIKQHLIRFMALLVLTGLLVTAVGCDFYNTANTIVSSTVEMPSTTSPSQTSTVGTTTQPTQTTTAEQTVIDDAFVTHVLDLLTRGLDDLQRSIVLTPALSDYRLENQSMRDALDRIHALYQQVLHERPELFYLDSQASLQYEYQDAASGQRLTGMVLESGFRRTYTDWSNDEIRAEMEHLHREADAVAALAAGRAEWDQLRVVHDELTYRIVYDVTLNQETNQAAGALLGGTTLCDGYARAFQLIVQKLDIPVRLVTGTARSGDEVIPHAWNQVELDGQLYHVDVTFDDPVPDRGAGGIAIHSHFLRSDTAMAATHTWDRQKHPASPVDGAHYYKNMGYTAGTRDELQQKMTELYREQDLARTSRVDIELLYTGPDQPTDQELTDLLLDIVRQSGYQGGFAYSSKMEKNVAICIVTTG